MLRRAPWRHATHSVCAAQDDCWQVARDASGTIVPDPVRFPSGMAALADYVHSKGKATDAVMQRALWSRALGVCAVCTCRDLLPCRRALMPPAFGEGLRFGVYTARGTETCQGRPGALHHEMHDAATYCSWNLDYLKIGTGAPGRVGGVVRPRLTL